MSIGTTTKDSTNTVSATPTLNLGEMPTMNFNLDTTDVSISRLTTPKFDTSDISLPGKFLPCYTVMYSMHRVNSKKA
ncbi:hypothetical protein [Staphylococcus simulans]|uniref:hypothetical protein n=1 Tax=Staphylococcus simulans TaxID=1286 RepID=UPI003CF3BA67